MAETDEDKQATFIGRIIMAGLTCAFLVWAWMSMQPKRITLDPWPFTVDYVTLKCRQSYGADGGAISVTAPDNTQYALNGPAISKYRQLPDPIWAPDPNNPGAKINISSAFDAAMALCLPDGTTAPPVEARPKKQ